MHRTLYCNTTQKSKANTTKMQPSPVLSPTAIQAIKARIHPNKPQRKAAFKNFQRIRKGRVEHTRPILRVFTDINWNPEASSRTESPQLSPFSMPSKSSPTELSSADTPTKDVVPGSKLIVRQATQGIQHIRPQAYIKPADQPISRPLEQVLLMAMHYKADIDAKRSLALDKLNQQILDSRSPRGSYSKLWKQSC